MTITYITICDNCGKRAEGWPQSSEDSSGFVSVSEHGDDQKHYCLECWQSLVASIRKP